MWIADGDWSLQAKASRRAALMQFYRYLVRTGMMQNNPVETVPGIRRPRPIAKQPAPEEAVMQGLVSADTEARLMVQLCSQVGLRREEISKVAASDIVAYGDGYALCVHGKGGKDRIVPISALLARDIQAKANGGWLFPGKGERWLALPRQIQGALLRRSRISRDQKGHRLGHTQLPSPFRPYLV
ncbi:tyrosine-type recombinase/integrase [Bifidobacterium bombi]|uniref:tyrosine-type recombinase/integrase n=1 Tax=Bifidobacterium bombi TaxID=471511 RepID=UPI000B0ADBD8|nr:hypothetical protein [Bifidobacterium bombi]